MNEVNKNFSKKLIDQYSKVKVYVVDGEAVRNSSKDGEEFGEVGTHCFYPKVIPNNEIWIEDDINEQERTILIASALVQIRAVEHGMSPDKAYEEGLKKEKDYRESLRQSKKSPSKTNTQPPESIYIKKYGQIGDVEVWLVCGEAVRNKYKIDWMEGGHGYVYKFVPNNDIWLENGLHEKELPLILLHEFVERECMKHKGFDYNKAHETAAKAEFNKRGKFSKEDALSLTSEKVLEMIKGIV